METITPHANQIVTKADLMQFQEELLNRMQQLTETSTQETPKWLRGSQVKSMLGISSGTLQNLRINGTIPYTKLGGTLFYDYQDIHNILESNKSQ